MSTDTTTPTPEETVDAASRVAYSHSDAANTVLTAAGHLDGRLPFATGLPEQLARPLAQMLQNIGDAMHDDGAVELPHPDNIPSKRYLVHPMWGTPGPLGYREDWTDALRLARAILGQPDPNAPEAVAQVAEPEYLIWSNHHGAWFAPNGQGYRSNVNDAGRYSLADTKQWLGRGCDCCEVPEVPVPAEHVLRAGMVALNKAITDATTAAIKAGDTNRHFAGSEVAR
jgi:hypothetical protein